MINIYLSIFVMVISFNCFTFTYRYNGINRTLKELPRSLLETSIPLIEEDDDLYIHFAKEELTNKLTYYFDSHLDKYTDDYTLNYYFTYTDEEAMCLDEYCTAVEINLKAKVLFFSNYDKTMRYEIRSNI